MRQVMYILLLFFLSINCASTAKTKYYGNETLICVNYKMPQSGFFRFLVFINENEMMLIDYVYSVNNNYKNATCSKMSEKKFNISEKNKYLSNLNFKTANEFKQELHNSLLEKYFKYFSENFLDMNNDEKIELLNKIERESKALR